MKKRYLMPFAEFELIEDFEELLKLSRFETEGEGTTKDNDPSKLPWGGDYEGGSEDDDDDELNG